MDIKQQSSFRFDIAGMSTTPLQHQSKRIRRDWFGWMITRDKVTDKQEKRDIGQTNIHQQSHPIERTQQQIHNGAWMRVISIVQPSPHHRIFFWHIHFVRLALARYWALRRQQDGYAWNGEWKGAGFVIDWYRDNPFQSFIFPPVLISAGKGTMVGSDMGWTTKTKSVIWKEIEACNIDFFNVQARSCRPACFTIPYRLFVPREIWSC